MIKYFWIIEDILSKKPTKYQIIMHEDARGVLQLLSLYLQNKCKYVLTMEYVYKCFEIDEIINLDIVWPES